jgi:MFS family permease
LLSVPPPAPEAPLPLEREAAPALRAPALPYTLVGLLSLALMINYIDRGSISIAAPLLEQELHLSTTQTFLMLSAFFWAYVPSQPFMGALVDHLGAARVLAGGFALWSAATFFAGVTAGIVGLVALRLLMGVGESVFYPSALALLSQRVTDRHRARATAVMQFGSVVGPALGAFIGGIVMVRFGWRAMFMGLGLGSALWLLPWSRQLRAPPVTVRSAAGAAPRLAAILRQRALWGIILGNFCSNYAFYFVFTALPLYLVHERGLSLLSMSSFTTAFYITDALSVLATGWLLDAWVQRGASPGRAYKTALALSAGGVGACLIAASGAGAAAGAALLLGTALADGLNTPAVCALTQRFAGPLATGRWMGVQNGTANTAGIVAPIATGQLVVAAGGHYGLALWVTGGVALVGLLAWLVLVPRAEPVDWGARQGGAR